MYIYVYIYIYTYISVYIFLLCITRADRLSSNWQLESLYKSVNIGAGKKTGSTDWCAKKILRGSQRADVNSPPKSTCYQGCSTSPQK